MEDRIERQMQEELREIEEEIRRHPELINVHAGNVVKKKLDKRIEEYEKSKKISLDP